MNRRIVRAAMLIGALAGAGSARADFVGTLNPQTISMATAVAFANSNVTVGTTVTDQGVNYNFLDEWLFTLDGSFLVSSITAALDFRDSNGNAVLLGINNLQVNLLTDPPNGAPLVSWLTVTTPVQGLEQSVALTPTSPLGAGNYKVEVRGFVTNIGTYSGSLLAQPLQPVPLPGSAALFACGILAIGFTSARSRRR